VYEGQVLSQPVFQKLYKKFNNGSVTLASRSDDKVCKIVVCGFSVGTRTSFDYGYCSEFWESRDPVDDRPFSVLKICIIGI
jgi:hypothetical protein